jgi:hypothetical protein
MTFLVLRLLVATLAATFFFAFFAISEGAKLFGGLLARLAVRSNFKRYGLVLVEGAKACTLERADMHEDVLATVVGRNEAITLRLVEPLHLACRHDMFSLS